MSRTDNDTGKLLDEAWQEYRRIGRSTFFWFRSMVIKSYRLVVKARRRKEDN